MTDFEKQVEDAIVAWYQNNPWYHKNQCEPWNQLYDEQKQIAAQLFWEEKLS